MNLKIINLSIIALILTGCDLFSSGSEGIIAAQNECLNNGKSTKEQCVCESEMLEEKLTEEEKNVLTAYMQLKHESLINKEKNHKEKIDRLEKKLKKMNIPTKSFSKKMMSVVNNRVEAKKACQ